MVPFTRRRALHGAAGLVAALAGCSGTGFGESESTRTHARETPADEPGHGSEADPPHVAVRSATDRPPVWFADEDGGGRPSVAERHYHGDRTVIDGEDRAGRVRVADGVDTEPVRSFLDETDFESETVYLEVNQVEECFRLELCSIQWQPDEVRTDYGRVLRPYDERCEADAKVYEARLIRIPDALDHEDVNGYGSSVGGGACGERMARARAEGDSASSSGSSSSSGAADGNASASTTGGAQ
ncbi:hypothetical protein [Halomicrobium urmianum]|uniref:hypothetical protein n=1 Tax=Halomicrobium urmianum TaxID=1586233 RepID=UPI001CD97D44|nr:hypothetical protein [Halomicrobium urmianum]